VNFGTRVEIGGLPIAFSCAQPAYIAMLGQRYANFIGDSGPAMARIGVTIEPPGRVTDAEDVEVTATARGWRMRRADFDAEWDPAARLGTVRQAAGNIYAIDTILRIVHSFAATEAGGFLIHAASAVRNGRAFLFSGVSGAGKTTLARLAPPDATLLTDEISYVRPVGGVYHAFGTPFAGELGVPGPNLSAPVAALHFLVQGPHNRIRPVSASLAARKLLRNILFFADDAAWGERVLDAACAFLAGVPVSELVFRPEPGVWDLIE
jgi:hypothetical protein